VQIPDTLASFEPRAGKTGRLHSLPALERAGVGRVSRLPVCLRVVLESLLRHRDGKRVHDADVVALARWAATGRRTAELPFVVARVLLQDFTGVPLIVDLAAMRSAVERVGKSPGIVEPLVPVELVVDHSVQVDYFARHDALELNMLVEMKRNRERYELLKWGNRALSGFKLVPPGVGICHQVNLEYLARGVFEVDGIHYPDTLVGTDSHTTMVNGLGVLGWGVGGIEAEAAMLGQPVYMLEPDVVGVCMRGALAAGVTATDLVLAVTELLRRANVVGKLVEFHGEGAASLPAAERATVANMAPEYGATIGFFPVDEETCRYFEATGRPHEQVEAMRRYYQAQEMFGIPAAGQCDYTQVIELDLGTVRASVAGPKRPQDRIDLADVKSRFAELLAAPAPGGYGKSGTTERHPVRIGRRGRNEPPAHGGGEQHPDTAPDPTSSSTSADTEREMMNNRPTPDDVVDPTPVEHAEIDVGDGDVLIAAITSCTNTSNPSVMLAAGLLAKKAVEAGLVVGPAVKTSLAPGSRIVSDYLERAGLQTYLDQLGFQLVGYGCTTCIGNSGPLDPALAEVVTQNDLVAAAVLSGNRNFEARVHQNLRANFLMSPPLVVAYAIAGRMGIDLTREPLGKGKDGSDVMLRDVWPAPAEIDALLALANDAEAYRRRYADVEKGDVLWSQVPSPEGEVYAWNESSTYVREPPYFEGFTAEPVAPGDLRNARALAVFGDSVTTDHISPAGAIQPSSPAGAYLVEQGVGVGDFNSYGARRGNHLVMVRGTFANVRIRNLLVPGVQGGVTVHQPSGGQMSIYDAATLYQNDGVPLVIFAGHDYGMGSSRDWAAKGTRLLGVRAVVAQSFERIHRSNLVGMGVLPCELGGGATVERLGIDGTETFDVVVGAELEPRQELDLVIRRASGAEEHVPLVLRIDTPIEVEYYRHGGILPYVLRRLVAR
jgi:aconitate hydratase A / 2-methylisocitrate dehydratase